MLKRNKLILELLGVVVLSLMALWIVLPSKSRIDLNKVGINFRQVYKVMLGLDLQGGSHLVYQAEFAGIKDSDKQNALGSVRDTIERRVNSFGVSEPLVQISGQDRIIVELPGIKDVNLAIKQIGETPILDFRVQNPNIPEVQPDAEGTLNIDPNSAWVPTGLSGKQLKRSSVDFQGSTQFASEPVVKLEFNEEGKKLFAEITQANLQKPVAIFLDGVLLSAPTVQSVITDGIAIISGNFTTDEARLLSMRLNSGALPVPIKLIKQQNVGATLGKGSIQNSLTAGIIGMILIAVFMLYFYRLPGLMAVVALLIYTVLAFAVFKVGVSFTAVLLIGLFFFLSLRVSPWFGGLAIISYFLLILFKALSPVTLTLAGIAGFILSIGMAVDANILIFERLKEEIMSGKDVKKAVDDGFSRAWLSIRDSNISSLITTSILYAFGTPSVKGFAVTLAIGILVSMFTAISVTRTLLELFLTNNSLSHPWLFGVSRKKLQ